MQSFNMPNQSFGQKSSRCLVSFRRGSPSLCLQQKGDKTKAVRSLQSSIWFKALRAASKVQLTKSAGKDWRSGVLHTVVLLGIAQYGIGWYCTVWYWMVFQYGLLVAPGAKLVPLTVPSSSSSSTPAPPPFHPSQLTSHIALDGLKVAIVLQRS